MVSVGGVVWAPGLIRIIYNAMGCSVVGKAGHASCESGRPVSGDAESIGGGLCGQSNVEQGDELLDRVISI